MICTLHPIVFGGINQEWDGRST